MALIDSTVLLGIADRLARQYQYIVDAFDNLTAVGTGLYATRVTGTDDVDVEIPTLDRYNNVDNNLSAATAATNGTSLGEILSAMESHFVRNNGSGGILQAGGWDGYLVSEDERVSEYFADLFYAVKNRRMLANVVFSEGDDQFGRVQITAGPTVLFTDGTNYGDGDALNQADGTKFAATQLLVRVTSMGATDADLRLTVKDENNSLTTIDVTVPASSPGGTEVDVGTSSDRFLDVTGVDFVPAGNQGTNSDDFTVRNKKERTIAL